MMLVAYCGDAQESAILRGFYTMIRFCRIGLSTTYADEKNQAGCRKRCT